MARRMLQGTVVSATKDKTVTVRVDSVHVHPKYHKRYTLSKKYLVHDPEGKAKIGEMVSFKETRPISKRKRFILVTQEKA